MKNNATSQNIARTGKLSFRTGFFLFIICVFLPGCMDNTPKCELQITGFCISNKVAPPFIDHIGGNNEVQRTVKFPEDELTGTESDQTQQENNSKNSKTTTENSTTTSIGKRAQSPINFPDPIDHTEEEHHFDPHDIGEEEHVIAIKLPGIMRLAIMLMLIVMMV